MAHKGVRCGERAKADRIGCGDERARAFRLGTSTTMRQVSNVIFTLKHTYTPNTHKHKHAHTHTHALTRTHTRTHKRTNKST